MYQSVASHFRLPALLLGAALFFGTAACNRDKKDEVSPDDTELRTSSEDHAIAENDDAIVAEAVESDAPTQADMGRPLPPDSTVSYFGGCATRTWDPATRTLTINFGPTNCLGRDGRNRRGIIRATFSGARYTPGSSVTITRDNYFVNDNQHLGTKTLTFTGYNQWHVSVTNSQVIFSAANGGGQKSWACERDVTRTAAPGVPTTFTVTGQASGTNRRGVAYTAQIQTPLIKRRELGCAGVFVDGTVLFSRATGKTALLNYNPLNVQPAPCDKLASITVGEITRQITLR